jgi:uncharacterized membrane protein
MIEANNDLTAKGKSQMRKGGIMNKKIQFKDKITLKIWDNYFNRIDKMIRSLDKTQKEETKLSIQDHLLDSFQNEKEAEEAVRLLNAIEKMGEPEEYLKPMVADKLLNKASNTMSPLIILKGLYYYIYGGIKRFVVSFSFIMGYILTLCFLLIAILKFFMPNSIGLFLYPHGGIKLGLGIPAGAAKDILGYWIVPIGIGLSALIYIILTRLLSSLKNR